MMLVKKKDVTSLPLSMALPLHSLIPAVGEPELFCLWMDYEHMSETSGIEKVTPYYFPKDNQSTMMGKWLKLKIIKLPDWDSRDISRKCEYINGFTLPRKYLISN